MRYVLQNFSTVSPIIYLLFINAVVSKLWVATYSNRSHKVHKNCLKYNNI
jgi:hypothetical protein